MSGLTLPEGILTLEHTLSICEDHLPSATVRDARDLLEKIRGRRSEGMEHTVVVFAGATGSGKSSLVNAVAGADVASVSAIRPTTSQTLAVSGGEVGGLLDWLEIKQRRVVSSIPSHPDSQLVLVDLPDIDSTEHHNRVLSERLIERADVVVWVLDPQKYADAVLHEDYLRLLREHSGAMLIVLNQIDTIDAQERPRVLRYLDSLLQADGVSAEVVVTSAVQGEGIEELRRRIRSAAATKQAAAKRLAADLRRQAQLLSEQVLAEEGRMLAPAEPPSFDGVSATLMAASGARVVSEAAAGSYLHRGIRATGWLGTSWMRRKGADPLAQQNSRVLVPLERQRSLARSSVRRYAHQASENLPRTWRRDVVAASEENAESLVDAADSLIASSDTVQVRRPAWWSLAQAIQWLSGLAAVVGLGWLLTLWITGAFRVAFPEPPAVGPVAVPTLLLVGGLLVGWLAALIARYFLRVGAARTSKRVSSALSRGLSAAARERILEPLRGDLEDYGSFVDDVGRLATTG
ncbi:GTPase [Actinomycetaceae bacterium L2_0104]